MMTPTRPTSIFLIIFFIAFTFSAQGKLEGQSDIGPYSIDLNPNRGVTGASYIVFDKVLNSVRISTTEMTDHNIITIKLKQAPVLVFKALANNQLVLLEAPVSEQWPYLIDHAKAKTYQGKPFSYSGDSYTKAVELFAELLSPLSKRNPGADQKIMWYRGFVFYGQFIKTNANGVGKVYDYETNELYLSCDKFVGLMCQGQGKQYDVSIPSIIYEGGFVDSKREGKGKEWLFNNIILEGNFIADKKEGPFVQRSEETEEAYGFTANGNYKNNQKVGSWYFRFSNAKEVKYIYDESGEFVSKTTIKEPIPRAANQNKSDDRAQQQLVSSFLNTLFVNEDKAEAEAFISPSFLQKVKKINANPIINAYASSQYELVRQNGNRILVNLYLLKGSKQLYNELTFSVEEEDGQYYIKPNIKDYDRGQYYDPWVDFKRVEK